MALESAAHTATLHKLGHDTIPDLTKKDYMESWPAAKTTEEEPKIPSPLLFEFGTAQDNATTKTDGRLPTIAECAAHLELLQVFYVQRQNILASTDIDDAMELKPDREKKTGAKGDTKTLKDTKWWDRRQEKWNRYLEFAAVRFLTWKDKLEAKDFRKNAQGALFLKHLPPIDVLMVWHSFLLNPRLFFTHCGKDLLGVTRFPWKAIHNAVDPKDWSFTLGAENAAYFENKLDLPPDLYQSFCEWVPGSKPQYSWEKAIPNLNAPSIPLTAFSLATATKVGPVTGAMNTKPKRAGHYYVEAFRSCKLDLAIALKDAVVRQASFVDKMNAHLWIRSPALEGTLRRAIDRYDKFLKLLAKDKKFIIVPTLDIDLVWHTNQCFSALGYLKTMKARVGRFINHDDTIGKETLGDGFGETRKLFRVYFGKEYRVCGCWDCEALLSEVEKTSSTSDPAVFKSIAAKVKQDVSFHRVVEICRRKKKPLPMAVQS